MSLVIAHTNGWMVHDHVRTVDGIKLPATPAKARRLGDGLVGTVGYSGTCDKVALAFLSKGEALLAAMDALEKQSHDAEALVVQGGKLFHVDGGGTATRLDTEWWAIGWNQLALGWLAGYSRACEHGPNDDDVSNPYIAQQCIRWVSTQTGAVSPESTVLRLTG